MFLSVQGDVVLVVMMVILSLGVVDLCKLGIVVK